MKTVQPALPPTPRSCRLNTSITARAQRMRKRTMTMTRGSARDNLSLFVAYRGAVVDASQELERGRTSFERRAWLDAYTALSDADRVEPLEASDLDLLATSASLIGRMDEYLALLERAHLAHVESGDNLAAARARAGSA